MHTWLRVLLAVLIWVEFTLICQGHTDGHYHIGPHFIFGVENNHPEHEPDVANESYIPYHDRIPHIESVALTSISHDGQDSQEQGDYHATSAVEPRSEHQSIVSLPDSLALPLHTTILVDLSIYPGDPEGSLLICRVGAALVEGLPIETPGVVTIESVSTGGIDQQPVVASAPISRKSQFEAGPGYPPPEYL